MAKAAAHIKQVDPVWHKLREEAQHLVDTEPALSGFIYDAVLNHNSLAEVLASHLAEKLGNSELGCRPLCELFSEVYDGDKSIAEKALLDIVASYERDPACRNYIDVVLYYKGYLALQSYRIAHWLYNAGRRGMALYIQNRASEVFQADIHPAAKIGKAMFIDHATGVVIGETAVVGDEVSLLHNVTLGGSGKEKGDRHPKIGNGVLISVGVKVLGNIHIGDCAKIGAGSVVLSDIPPYSTAVGVPAKLIGKVSEPPSHTMNHNVMGSDNTEGENK